MGTAQAFKTSTPEADAGGSHECKASRVYRVSFSKPGLLRRETLSLGGGVVVAEGEGRETASKEKKKKKGQGEIYSFFN